MIERELVGKVEVVRLARPPLNLIDSLMIQALTDVFRALRDAPPRACVLFCAGGGADVREMLRFDLESARIFITSLHRACATIRELDAPVIAAVDGPCLGAHLELAAACDLRIASETSTLGMPEIRVGIPSVIDAYWLALLCGLGNASAMLFEGGTIPAGEAFRIGLLNRVAADGALAHEALAWAHVIAGHSPAALVQQKRVLRDWTHDAYQAAAAASIERFVQTIAAGEFKEAMQAMLSKRAPSFEDGSPG